MLKNTNNGERGTVTIADACDESRAALAAEVDARGATNVEVKAITSDTVMSKTFDAFDLVFVSDVGPTVQPGAWDSWLRARPLKVRLYVIYLHLTSP